MVWPLSHPRMRDWPCDAEVMAVMYGRNGRCGRFPRHAVVGTAPSLPLGEKYRIPGCSGRSSGADELIVANGGPLFVQAVQHVRRMRGGAQSHLMRCADGFYYVVKFQNNPQHTRVL